MELPTARIKHLNQIKGLEKFDHYAIDTNGHAWSFKHKKPRKLRPGWAKEKGTYLFVRITDRNGTKKNVYLHRLVAMAYLPCDDFTYKVKHINKISTDNKIENLAWVPRREAGASASKKDNDLFVLDEMISNKLKEVHAASHRKGLPVHNSYKFMNNMIDEALEQYIIQYGLRKVMNNNTPQRYL